LNWCTRFCRPLRNHSATWPHGPRSIYSLNGLSNRPTSHRTQHDRREISHARFHAYRHVSAGYWFAAGADSTSARSVACPGGSRARAMLMRQPCCENEIVPSLHSNLAVAASAIGGDVSGTAACCGAAACAAVGFSDKAQPVHESEISTTMPIRICAASENYSGGNRASSFRDPPSRP
jgi:hypothetical protein